MRSKDVNKPREIKMEDIESIISNKSKILKFNRFRKLSEKVCIEENDFVIVAGRTSIGKTAYA